MRNLSEYQAKMPGKQKRIPPGKPPEPKPDPRPPDKPREPPKKLPGKKKKPAYV